MTTLQKSTPVTDEDLRHAAESLSEVETLWMKLSSLTDPTIPCPECRGSGILPGGGIFGEIPCDECKGSGVVEHPAGDQLAQLAMPDFKGLRRRLSAMTSAHDKAQRQAYLGEGDGISPVTHEELAALEQEIGKVREEGRGIAAKQASGDRALPPARRSKEPRYGSLGSGGEED